MAKQFLISEGATISAEEIARVETAVQELAYDHAAFTGKEA
jgi:hypothetical protein